MPEGFPSPKGLLQKEIELSDQFCEELHGRVIGSFTPTEVSNGPHPEEVRSAWIGVAMPVRAYPNVAIHDTDHVFIDAGEAFNALVANNTPEEILQYWIDTLPGDAGTKLGFILNEGEYEPFPDEQQTLLTADEEIGFDPDGIPF